ncbi:MAG: class I SAM-dependent methyltransferase [Acidobacteriota bacterium]|nr:class I SAM-dependent methyltransferase [Acidobacteriota bacterium]
MSTPRAIAKRISSSLGTILRSALPAPQGIKSSDFSSAADHWSEVFSGNLEELISRQTYWLAIPEVQERYNRLATGGRHDDWIAFCLSEYLSGALPVERMLSIGCGQGDLELGLASHNAFREFDAFDIAEGAISAARARAKDAGVLNVNFEVQDVNRLTLAANRYDAAWFNMSLHHIEALEHVCGQVSQALKPGGFLFVNEYVGPSRFDFSARQKEVLDLVNRLLPKKYRRVPPPLQQYRDSPPVPDPAEVSRVDPSEAVRSSDILKVLPQFFDIQTCHPIGGTILQFLLGTIAWNFRTEDPDSIKVLKMLFTIEETLIEVGDLQSDFALIVARPKKGLGDPALSPAPTAVRTEPES